jgi:hypothetical protein
MRPVESCMTPGIFCGCRLPAARRGARRGVRRGFGGSGSSIFVQPATFNK